MKSRLRVIALCLLLSTAPAAATITTSQNAVTIAGNGSQTAFGFGFVGVSASDISVIYTTSAGVQTTLVQGPGATQYQVSLNSPAGGQLWGIGGVVTYNPSGSPIPNGSTLTITRTVPNEQTVNLQNQASFGQYAKSAEQMGDLLEMQIQQNTSLASRAIVANPANTSLPQPLPPAGQAANLGLCFDGTGNNVIACSLLPSGTVSSAMQPVVNAATLEAGRIALGVGDLCVNIQTFGGVGDDATDNTAALSSALGSLSGTGGCVYVPPGKFLFSSSVSYTLPASQFSLNIYGAGQDATILTWPNATGGIQLSLQSGLNALHVRDLSFTTSQASGGTALGISNSVSLGNLPGSDISRVTFAGEDRAGLSNYWTTGIRDLALSNINFYGLTFFGNAAGTGGTGLVLTGQASPSEYMIIGNIYASNFFNMGLGIEIGTQVQGITVNESVFVSGLTGIQVDSSGNDQVQLNVTNSEFNVQGEQINMLTAMSEAYITNNLFFVPANASGLFFQNANTFNITGNIFGGFGGSPPSGATGITIGATAPGSKGVIMGNQLNTLDIGINLTSSSSGTTIEANSFIAAPGFSSVITDSGSLDFIRDNDGYNPVGGKVISVGMSPFTYTAGASPETVYINGGSSMTITFGSITGSITGVACIATPCTVDLGPHERLEIQYGSSPAANTMVH